MATETGDWTLTEAARLLQESQHRLIYLCEKGVVEPDVKDAEGRGSSRRFSGRNLLEFALALRLRQVELPAATIASVVRVLRGFEGMLRGETGGFHLPNSLRAKGAPDLRVVISDGRRLYFMLRNKGATPRIFGGVDVSKGVPRKRLPPIAEVVAGTDGTEFGGLEGSRHVRVEVNVTRIAQELQIPADRA